MPKQSAKIATVLMIVLALSLFLGACKSSDDEVFKGNGNVEVKPEMFGAQDATPNEPVSLMNVSYDVTVTTASGAKPCTGVAQIQVDSKFQMKFPELKLKCLSLEIDVGKMLAGMSQEAGKKPGVSSDGKVMRVKQIGAATFDPPRPLLLGPVIQDPSKYEGFQEKKAYSVTVNDPKTGATSNGNGEIEVRVLGVNEPFATDAFPDDFKSVLHWEMVSTGFKGVPAAQGLLFERLEFYWNMRPIMVPKIVIEGNLTDFISGGGAGGAGGGGAMDAIAGIGAALFGKLKIELTVKDYSR